MGDNDRGASLRSGLRGLLKKLSDWMAALAAICLVALMAITFIDVIGRYYFNRPLTFAVELTELGMGLLVFLGLASTTFSRGHISVDLLSSVVPKPIKRHMARLAALIGFVFIALMSWRLFERAGNFLADGLATQVLYIPVYPVVFVMAGAALVAAVIVIRQCFESDGVDDNV